MKTFLHVGCGPKRKDQTTRGFNTPEWHELRLDIDQSVTPYIVGTITCRDLHLHGAPLRLYPGRPAGIGRGAFSGVMDRPTWIAII